MARRMYDLDNGTENIKVKDITCNKITAVTSAITTECDDIQVIGSITVGHGRHQLSATGGASFMGFVKFPGVTSGTRPNVTGLHGVVIYDATLGKLILWNGTTWVNIDGTSLGE